MNSKETLTCNLFQLPQDIFRVIFQYLSVDDLMDGEEAFLNNQELLSLYRSSLQGFTLKETITNQEKEYDKLISWIIDHKLLVVAIELTCLRDLDMNLLNQSRSSLKTITFCQNSTYSDNPVTVISQLGHFPSLTSAKFYCSQYFANETLVSFFSHNPQLELVQIDYMHQFSDEIIPRLSNFCPNIKILSLSMNYWVNDETMSLLTQQRLFPNLKSLNLQNTNVTNEESLRQFILSRPLLSGLLLPFIIQYSNDFLVFYLRQLIFPSILSHNNNNNDLESHSLAITTLYYLFGERILDGRDDVVNPEIFSVDILSHLYHKDCPLQIRHHSAEIFSHLSKFPSMIDSILQSQFIPFILNDTNPHDYLPFGSLGYLLFRCGIFHDYFPFLVQKYRSKPYALFQIFHRVIQDYFSDLTTEELQTMIPIVLNELPDKDSTYNCLKIISKLLQEPFSQHLVDPNSFLLSFKSIQIPRKHSDEYLFDCLKRFISVNENYRQLFIESNLLSQIIKSVDTTYLIDFISHCLLSSGDGLLVDHLVNSGVFQKLLSKYSQLPMVTKNEMEALFKLLIEFNNNKYSEIVREMKLPDELRVKLIEKGNRVCVIS